MAQVACHYCGKEFMAIAYRLRAQRTQGPRKYCSKKCHSASMVKLEPTGHKDKLKAWRNKVLEKDNYRCVCCGEVELSLLQAHHIVYQSENEKLHYVVSNGQTLCICCHADTHKGESAEQLLLGLLKKRFVAA